MRMILTHNKLILNESKSRLRPNKKLHKIPEMMATKMRIVFLYNRMEPGSVAKLILNIQEKIQILKIKKIYKNLEQT